MKYLNFGGFLLSEKRDRIFDSNLSFEVTLKNKQDVITERYSVIFFAIARVEELKNAVFIGVTRVL